MCILILCIEKKNALQNSMQLKNHGRNKRSEFQQNSIVIFESAVTGGINRQSIMNAKDIQAEK